MLQCPPPLKTPLVAPIMTLRGRHERRQSGATAGVTLMVCMTYSIRRRVCLITVATRQLVGDFMAHAGHISNRPWARKAHVTQRNRLRRRLLVQARSLLSNEVRYRPSQNCHVSAIDSVTQWCPEQAENREDLVH